MGIWTRLHLFFLWLEMKDFLRLSFFWNSLVFLVFCLIFCFFKDFLLIYLYFLIILLYNMSYLIILAFCQYFWLICMIKKFTVIKV